MGKRYTNIAKKRVQKRKNIKHEQIKRASENWKAHTRTKYKYVCRSGLSFPIVTRTSSLLLFSSSIRASTNDVDRFQFNSSCFPPCRARFAQIFRSTFRFLIDTIQMSDSWSNDASDCSFVVWWVDVRLPLTAFCDLTKRKRKVGEQ